MSYNISQTVQDYIVTMVDYCW